MLFESLFQSSDLCGVVFCVFKEDVGKPNSKSRVFLLLRKHFNKMKCCQHLKLSVIQTPTTKDALSFHRFSLFYFSVNKNHAKYLWTTIKTQLTHTLTAWLQTLHKGHTINHPSSLVTQTHICFISLWYKHTLVVINPTTFQVLSTFPSLQYKKEKTTQIREICISGPWTTTRSGRENLMVPCAAVCVCTL